MPSGFYAALPTDTLLDAGVISFGGVTYGVTRGGIAVASKEVWQNIGFDGKRADVALLDRKIGMDWTISTRFIEMTKAKLARLQNQGGIAGMASLTVAQAAALSIAVAASYASGADGVPLPASSLYIQGDYAVNMRVTWARGGGGSAAVLFPLALVTKWSMVGGNKDAAEISAEFSVKQDLSASQNTDTAPWRVEIT